MKELGQDNFVYVADSALITKENLRLVDDEKNGFRFLSRPLDLSKSTSSQQTLSISRRRIPVFKATTTIAWKWGVCNSLQTSKKPSASSRDKKRIAPLLVLIHFVRLAGMRYPR